MKLHKSLIGTLAILLGFNSIASWAADNEPKPQDKKEDTSSEQRKDGPTKEQKSEPICFGGNDGK